MTRTQTTLTQLTDEYGDVSDEVYKTFKDTSLSFDEKSKTYTYQKKKEIDPHWTVGLLKKSDAIKNLDFKPGESFGFGSDVTLGQGFGGLAFLGSVCTADWASRFSQLKSNVTTCYEGLKNNLSSVSPEAWASIVAVGLGAAAIYAIRNRSDGAADPDIEPDYREDGSAIDSEPDAEYGDAQGSEQYYRVPSSQNQELVAPHRTYYESYDESEAPQNKVNIRRAAYVNRTKRDETRDAPRSALRTRSPRRRSSTRSRFDEESAAWP